MRRMRRDRGASPARYVALTIRTARGLTLVELLVVIGIIGLLAALLLPAVQAAREAGRRIQCQDHVRQTGLALQNHHSVQGRLPPGWVTHTANGGPGWGWAAIILPGIDQQALQDASDAGFGPGGPGGPGSGGKPIGDPANRRFRETPIPLLLCPSDPYEDLFTLHRGGPGGGPGGPPMFDLARANYLGVFGTRTLEANPRTGDGTFFQNSSVRFADIRDGLSNTLMVGERCTRLDCATWVGAVPGAYQGKARVVGRAGSVPNHVLNDFSDFSSYHPFGANFVLGDGSAKLISDEIDLAVYRALATRSGGEVTSSPP